MEASRLNSVCIEPMQTEHLEGVVATHLESFPGFFLTFLGPRFLRLLYKEILSEPGHVACVAVLENHEVCGFVAGVEQQAGFFRRLAKRRLLPFALAASGALVKRPAIIIRLIRAVLRPPGTHQVSSPSLLMSLAVSKRLQGRGIGARLVEQFLEEMKERGQTTVSLTTDRDNNDAVNQFYLRLGFMLAQSYDTPEGRGMNEYVIDLGAKEDRELRRKVA